MPHDFVQLAEHIADALLESDPHLASSAGDHRFDGRLPTLSADAVTEDVAMLRDASAALSQVDIDALDQQAQVDHAVLLARVERALFERTEIREHEWNPLVHNPGGLLHDLISRPFAPAEERISSLAMRLARRSRRARRRSHRAAGHAASARGDRRRPVRRHGRAGPRRAGRAARRGPGADQRTSSRCRRRPPRSSTTSPPGCARRLDGADRDPRIGRRLWEARLWHALDSELTAKQILDRAEANLDRVGAELREAAAEFLGEPATDETARAALDRLGADHPDDATIVDSARHTLDEATATCASTT